jgi:hypothetical protein
MALDKATEEMLAEALRNPAKYGVSGCALCQGDRISVTALFVPTEALAKRIGQPKNKQRLIVYGLCNSCATLSNVPDRVEEAILKDMGTH